MKMNLQRNIRLEYFGSAEIMYEKVAGKILSTAKMAVKKHGIFSIALAGGKTPLPLYKLLGSEKFSGAFPWDQTHFFWGDERYTCPYDDFSNFLCTLKAFAGMRFVSEKNIHRINTDIPIEASAYDYEHALRKFAAKYKRKKLFDLVILGTGEDGHTASIFPRSYESKNMNRLVCPVTNLPRGIQPPLPRITLTIPALSSTEMIFLLATGEKKKKLLENIYSGEKTDSPIRTLGYTNKTVFFIANKNIEQKPEIKMNKAYPLLVLALAITLLSQGCSSKSEKINSGKQYLSKSENDLVIAGKTDKGRKTYMNKNPQKVTCKDCGFLENSLKQRAIVAEEAELNDKLESNQNIIHKGKTGIIKETEGNKKLSPVKCPGCGFPKSSLRERVIMSEEP